MKRIFLSISLSLIITTLCASDTIDSLAFMTARWEVVELEKGAKAMHAQIPMFDSMQNICVIKYPAKKFRSGILHRPGEAADKPSVIGQETRSSIAINGGYFHVKERVPSVYFRRGRKVISRTHPTEVYRVDGVVGFRDRRGKKMVIAYSDTTQYEKVAGKWHTVMASGPMLIADGEITVPQVMGDRKDGDNVSAMQEEQKNPDKVRTHYSSSQFYDRRHPRAAIGTDNEGYIYYVVIDGRFKGEADGASIYETAYICHLLGMTDAINLDGGGSATLWNATTGVINHPYDNKKFDHEGERSVPNLFVAE